MAARIYVPIMMFGVRIVNMQHLWNPSSEYQGKKQETPSYFITCVTQKTRQNWWEEPILASNVAAYNELLTKSGMSPQMVTEWPIRDGDMPPEPGKAPSEWARGHWVFGGSSTSAIKVEISQNNAVVPLPSKVGVKPGDYVALGLSTAIKQNNPRAIKHFCNTVLFTGPGEEIAVGNSVSGTELMAQAQAQGYQVAGFHSSPGFGAAPHGGFPGAPAHQQGGFPGAPQGGFTPPAGPAGFAPGSQPGNPGPNQNPAMMGAPALPGIGGGFTPPTNGNATFPSNGAPQGGFTAPQQAFGAPNAPVAAPFTAPSGPVFPGR